MFIHHCVPNSANGASVFASETVNRSVIPQKIDELGAHVRLSVIVSIST